MRLAKKNLLRRHDDGHFKHKQSHFSQSEVPNHVCAADCLSAKPMKIQAYTSVPNHLGETGLVSEEEGKQTLTTAWHRGQPHPRLQECNIEYSNNILHCRQKTQIMLLN